MAEDAAAWRGGNRLLLRGRDWVVEQRARCTLRARLPAASETLPAAAAARRRLGPGGFGVAIPRFGDLREEGAEEAEAAEAAEAAEPIFAAFAAAVSAAFSAFVGGDARLVDVVEAEATAAAAMEDMAEPDVKRARARSPPRVAARSSGVAAAPTAAAADEATGAPDPPDPPEPAPAKSPSEEAQAAEVGGAEAAPAPSPGMETDENRLRSRLQPPTWSRPFEIVKIPPFLCRQPNHFFQVWIEEEESARWTC